MIVGVMCIGCGGTDAERDGGPVDIGHIARFPWNGYTTGSVHVPLGAPVVDHPLRPKFMWEAMMGASSYDLQVDDSCMLSAFRTCAFASPEADVSVSTTTHRLSDPLPVSMMQPVGRRYYWRVRACESPGVCSAWSEVRYLDVGRHADDFNGDGYADLVVGAFGQSNPEIEEGNAFVYLGGPTGPGAAPDVTLDNPADQEVGWFGDSVASAGDVNGDGYADLVVGAPRQSNPEMEEGTAFVYLGGPTGPGSAPDVTLDNPTDQTMGGFGHSVASAGDVDGDGYADLIVGAFGQSNPEIEEGNAFVYLGGPTGPSAAPDLTLDNPADQASGYFGGSVASAGDVDGDGYADLVVGAKWVDNPEIEGGNAFVYLGGPTGPASAPDVTLDNPADQASGYFGGSVASAGDVDGDGYADLIVGAFGQSNPERVEGNAFVYLGGPTGPASAPDLTLDNPADQEGGWFGYSVAGAGDVDGDGYADLIVGAHGQSNPEMEEGNAFVYLGSPTGPGAAPDLTLDNPADQVSAFFGLSVASAGDVNGDGYADLVVGAVWHANPEAGEGNAFVYLGTSTGPGVAPELTLDNPADQVDGGFGVSVASVGNAPRSMPHRAMPGTGVPLHGRTSRGGGGVSRHEGAPARREST